MKSPGGELENAPLRRAALRHQIQALVRPERRKFHFVFESRDLVGGAAAIDGVVRELSAVAIRHGHEQRMRKRRVVHLDLGDAGKTIAEHLPIGRDVGSEAMEPHCLIEMAIGLRAVGAWEARVPDGAGVLRPGGEPPAVGYCTCGMTSPICFPRLDFEEVKIAVLAAAA